MSDLPDGINPNNNNPITPGNFAQQQYLQGVEDNESLAMGVTAGTAAAIVGGVLWAVVTYYTGFQIGWMAVGIGFLVGFSIRHFGKGKDVSFSIAGAFLALVGCLLGNIFTVCIYISNDDGVGIFDVISDLDIPTMTDFVIATFEPMDAIFYGLAIYEGFKYSVIRTKPNKEIKN